MKIKSNVEHNTSFHRVASCKASLAAPDYLTIPAGSTVELDDELWLGAYAKAGGIAGGLATGALLLVEQPKSNKSAAELVELIFAQAGVEADVEKGVEGLQDLANKLDVDLFAEAEEKDVPVKEAKSTKPSKTKTKATA